MFKTAGLRVLFLLKLRHYFIKMNMTCIVFWCGRNHWACSEMWQTHTHTHTIWCFLTSTCGFDPAKLTGSWANYQIFCYLTLMPSRYPAEELNNICWHLAPYPHSPLLPVCTELQRVCEFVCPVSAGGRRAKSACTDSGCERSQGEFVCRADRPR